MFVNFKFQTPDLPKVSANSGKRKNSHVNRKEKTPSMFPHGILLLTVFFLLSKATFAQKSGETEKILNEAGKQIQLYREIFRNLLAEEVKSFEEFDKNEKPKEKTVVKSNFLAYLSGKNQVPVELRNVFEVNGKMIPDGQERSEKFLAELQKEKTYESELKRIVKESNRYDKNWNIHGLTLNEGLILSDNLRPYFDFQLVKRETIQGYEIYVLSYQQTRKSPFIRINSDGKTSQGASLDFEVEIPSALKKYDVFLAGKLWIDAQTYQIRREERNLVIQSPTPLIILSTIFDYQNSDFGILPPKSITFKLFRLRKNSSGTFSASLESMVTFEYSKFRKTETEIRILDDDEEIQ
jgi:hypothetical protein